MVVFVSGVSGSGKSRLMQELQSRGFEARDTDRGLSKTTRKDNGTRVIVEHGSALNESFRAAHLYSFDIEKIRKLTLGMSGKPLFLCGAAYGYAQMCELADHAFYLKIGDAEELKRRLLSRPDSYGKKPQELGEILNFHKQADSYYRSFGMRAIEAERPPAEIADQILSLAGLASSIHKSHET